MKILADFHNRAAFQPRREGRKSIHTVDGISHPLRTFGRTANSASHRAPATWINRAIYRVGVNQVSLWSNPTSVTVPA
jgi:hypothetical protein